MARIDELGIGAQQGVADVELAHPRPSEVAGWGPNPSPIRVVTRLKLLSPGVHPVDWLALEPKLSDLVRG